MSSVCLLAIIAVSVIAAQASQPTDPSAASQPTDPTAASQPTDPAAASQPTDPSAANQPTDPSAATFCTKYSQAITDAEFRDSRRAFCKLEIHAKRNALLCDKISASVAARILLPNDEDIDCFHSPEEVLSGKDGNEVALKLDQNCKEECQEDKKKSLILFTEAEKKTEKYINDEIDKYGQITNTTTNSVQGIQDVFNSLKVEGTLNIISDSAKQYITIRANNVTKQQLDHLYEAASNDMKLDPQSKARLKERIEKAIESSPNGDISLANIVDGTNKDLELLATKKSEALKKNKILKDTKIKVAQKLSNIKRGLKGMSKTDGILKSAQAAQGIISSVDKFKEGGASNIIGGVLDIGNAIAQFLPPPASIVTGAISSIFNLFTGSSAPSVEDTIKSQFKEHRQFLNNKFDKLSGEIADGFEKQSELHHKTQEYLVGAFTSLEQYIDAKYENNTEERNKKQEEIDRLANIRTVDGILSSLQEKLIFIKAIESSQHNDAAASTIANEINTFENSPKKTNVRNFLEEHCFVWDESDVVGREICTTMAYSYLMIERNEMIILSKLITILSTTGLQSINLGYLRIIENRKQVSEQFLTRSFTSNQRPSNVNIRCALYDKSVVQHDLAQRTEMWNFASYLNPELPGRMNESLVSDCGVRNELSSWGSWGNCNKESGGNKTRIRTCDKFNHAEKQRCRDAPISESTSCGAPTTQAPTQAPAIKYIGSLSNPSAHPYVYSSRATAANACRSIGYRGLCTKKQGEGFEKCAAGFYSDFKGYWMSQTHSGCGSGKGFRTWGDGNVGAYCCLPSV